MRRNWLPLLVMLVVSASMFIPQQSLPSHKPVKRQDLVGTWMYVESYLMFPDGRRLDQFTREPAGIFMLNDNGWYTHIIMRPDLPPVKAGVMMEATPEEVQLLAKGTLSHYGTWTVNERGGFFTVNILKSDFPNFDGLKQVRHIRHLDQESLHYVNEVTNAGPGTVVFARLRRLKKQ